MEKQNNYVCKKASLEEIKIRWDNEIKRHPNNIMYTIARQEYIDEAKKSTRITYIGLLNDNIICDATAIIKPEGIQNESQSKENLVSQTRCYLCGIRTNKEYENQGYFSRLYNYIEKDLVSRGFKEIALSVDVSKTRNLLIYFHLGYTNYIRTETITNNNSTYIFNYYYKKI